MVRWLPLESNPEVINKYMRKLGVSAPWNCVDIYGFDEELLCMVPQPVVAVMLLFPITPKNEEIAGEEVRKLEAEGYKADGDLIFMKQFIGNACGTVAAIHSLANNMDTIKFKEDSLFKKFAESLKGVSPDKISEMLENDEMMTAIHEEFAAEGQSARIDRDEKVNLHFVAMVHKNGKIYEMDGRKPFPICHGGSSPVTFLADAASVCKKFMQREPDNLRYTAIALCGSEEN